MLTLNIYVILTLLITTYSFFTLYQRENQFFLFSIYLLKSKTYFCICLNFCLMLLILVGKFIIKILFNEIRVSEMLVYFMTIKFIKCFLIYSLNIILASSGKVKDEIFKLFLLDINFKTDYGYLKNTDNCILYFNADTNLFDIQKI